MPPLPPEAIRGQQPISPAQAAPGRSPGSEAAPDSPRWRLPAGAVYTPGVPIFEPVLERLAERGGRFVVVGGLAVVLHGHPRLTVDLDLVVDLEPEAARRTIEALTSLGLRPLARVDPFDFADAGRRRAWIEEKGPRDFSFYDPGDALGIVDLFVEPPFDFEELWANARGVELGPVKVRVASIPDLIRMKRQAGLAQDLDDIDRLQEIERRRGGEGAMSAERPREAAAGSPDEAWARTTWEGNARWRAERVLAATPHQRLLWLESALELAWRAGAFPDRRPRSS